MSGSTAATAAPAAPPPPPPPPPPLPAESPPPRPTRAGHRAPRHCAGRPRAASPAACPGPGLRSSCPVRPGTKPISLPQARAFCPGSAPARLRNQFCLWSITVTERAQPNPVPPPWAQPMYLGSAPSTPPGMVRGPRFNLILPPPRGLALRWVQWNVGTS